MERILPDGDKLVTRGITSHDGATIFYQSLGDSPNVIVMANGLGGRIYTWEAVIRKLYPKYRIISWDYRGLFDSKTDDYPLSIPHHAEDLKCILDNEGIEKVCTIGWSMGVQVSLEFSHRYPDMVEKMVLVNGTYGNVIETGFQPFFRMPCLKKYLYGLIDIAKGNKIIHFLRDKVLPMLNPCLEGIGMLYSKVRKNCMICQILPQYIEDNMGNNLDNILQLIVELDIHTTYHFLNEIKQEVLIICGKLDPLTPSYQSKEIHRRLPNSELVTFYSGTHLAPVEFPRIVPKKIYKFLES